MTCDVPSESVEAMSFSTSECSFVLDVKASGNVPTTFTRLLGQEQLDIGSSAQVKWGVKKLELALVTTPETSSRHPEPFGVSVASSESESTSPYSTSSARAFGRVGPRLTQAIQ